MKNSLLKKRFPQNLILISIFICFFLLSTFNIRAQEKEYKAGCIAFYNLENLFDTINTENVRDEEFTPEGPNKWTPERYLVKLDKLAEVISQIGYDFTNDAPAIIGVSEIENIDVLEDLVNTPALKPYNYKIVHYNSPDKRGIDVGLLYQPKYFTVTGSVSYELGIEGRDDFFSRDQLLVSGLFDGEPINIVVNHWPSRRGGEKASRPLRIAAAKLSRSIADSLLQMDENAKVIVMGDFNDDPVDPSVKDFLKTSGKIDKIPKGYFYNPMDKLFKKGIGSLAWRDSWNLFDQIVVSQGLIGNDKKDFKFYKAGVYNKKHLKNKEGRYAGYPLRTYAGGIYQGGYSDHFPVYIYLIKEI